MFGWNKKPAEPAPEPTTVTEEPAPLDLTGYTLYFCDEFNGDALDYSVWADWNVGPKNHGFLAPSQLSVKDGNLILTGEYREDGMFGPGRYGARICPRKWYIRGYYEIRCKCADGPFNSAFWLQSEYSYDHARSRGGPGGAEVDIMESYLWKETDPRLHSSITSNVHVNGSDDDPDNIESYGTGAIYVDGLYSDYHAFGLKWTESEYIFYVDGRETARTSFAAGLSEVWEFMLVSIGLPEENHDRGDVGRFLVDYVKIYQQRPELYSIPNRKKTRSFKNPFNNTEFINIFKTRSGNDARRFRIGALWRLRHAEKEYAKGQKPSIGPESSHNSGFCTCNQKPCMI